MNAATDRAFAGLMAALCWGGEYVITPNGGTMFKSLPIDYQLFLAVDALDHNQAVRLLDAGANPNARLWESLQEDTPLDWVELATCRLAGVAADTPFTRAIHHGDTMLAALMKAGGADVDQADSHGRTAIFYACAVADESAIGYLVHAGAALENGFAGVQDWPTARLLIDAGAQVAECDRERLEELEEREGWLAFA